MAYAENTLGQMFNEHLNNLHTAMPCEVIEYHEDENVADIKPNFARKKGGEITEYPLIEKVPILRHVGKVSEGDTVFVIFAERALDHVGDRRHDLRDAVIIGVM